jgi:O-antigen/teichoic acid export membrane protein
MAQAEQNIARSNVEHISEMQFVRASSFFAASRLFGAFIGLARAFLIARWLGPASYGTWQFLNIFGQYGSYADLSTRSAINREIPFLRGTGDSEQICRVLGTVFVVNIYGPIIYSLLVFGCSLFLEDPVDASALAAYSPVILLLSWANFGSNLAMSLGLYDIRTRQGLLDDILTGLLAIFFVYFWGIQGVILAFGLSGVIINLYLAFKLRSYFAFKIDVRVLWELILKGMPIMANGFLLISMGTIDRILIAAMLSREMLGFYGVANAGVGILKSIPVSIGQMLFVRFAEMDGQKQSNRDTSAVLDRSTFVLSTLLALTASLAIACLPIVVVYFLPQYASGIAPGRLLIAGVFFLGVSLPATNWCISTGRFRFILLSRIVVMTAQSGAMYLAIRNGGGLEAVALLAVCAFGIFSVVVITLCNHFLDNTFLVGMLRTSKSLLPFVSIFAGLWVQEHGYPIGIYVTGPRIVVSCLLGFTASLLTFLPFGFCIHKYVRLSDLISKRPNITMYHKRGR